MDYCPTHPAVVLGHHFSSIAGAGPIVGPITAASMFGWLPTIVWCIFGSIFLGGPHDFGAVMASMRHDGKSIGEVIDHWIGHKAKKLFLIFTILSLFLVVAVFTVLTTATFVLDPVVAFVSCMYIVLAVVSGLLIYRFNMNLKLVTVVMLAIIAFCSIKGGDWPIINTRSSVPMTPTGGTSSSRYTSSAPPSSPSGCCSSRATTSPRTSCTSPPR